MSSVILVIAVMGMALSLVTMVLLAIEHVREYRSYRNE